MSTPELEQELRRWRDPAGAPPTGAPHLSVAEALAYRDAGNLPDQQGRTLRLVVHLHGAPEPGLVERRRLELEPDYHEEPTWRRAGSAPINVVPLRIGAKPRSDDPPAWFEEPQLAALEAEWQGAGTVAGLRVPADLRGFVFKTVLALGAAGKEVSARSVADSIARWVPPADAAKIRAALVAANPSGPSGD
ncbi:hypothetical protein BH24ACT26_BH24ACT26_22240 [soil metagenome]